jgi:hypothetical protein
MRVQIHNTIHFVLQMDEFHKELEAMKKKMQEPEFPREYQSMYLGRIGNVFSSSQIETCIKLGEEFSNDKIPVSLYTLECWN